MTIGGLGTYGVFYDTRVNQSTRVKNNASVGNFSNAMTTATKREIAYRREPVYDSVIIRHTEYTDTDPEIPLHSLTKETRQQLLNDLKHFRLTYQGLEDIDRGIVTSGGVDVNEIDPKTMRSKLCKDLYFIGEILDVDALTGGFNLQIALSTAYSCARGILNE